MAHEHVLGTDESEVKEVLNRKRLRDIRRQRRLDTILKDFHKL